MIVNTVRFVFPCVELRMNLKKLQHIKYESKTLKQAQHKNFGLQAHLENVNKIYEREKCRQAAEIEAVRKQIAESLKRVRRVFPVPGRALELVHAKRRRDIQDVSVHVVQCYMQRQEKNKERWNAMMSEDPNSLETARPVTTPEHLEFIEGAFPEIYDVSSDNPWRYTYNPKGDIYEHGRAAHDMKCLSTRSKPVGASTGAYPPRQPINMRFWMPPDSSSMHNTQSAPRKRDKELMLLRRKQISNVEDK